MIEIVAINHEAPEPARQRWSLDISSEDADQVARRIEHVLTTVRSGADVRRSDDQIVVRSSALYRAQLIDLHLIDHEVNMIRTAINSGSLSYYRELYVC